MITYLEQLALIGSVAFALCAALIRLQGPMRPFVSTLARGARTMPCCACGTSEPHCDCNRWTRESSAHMTVNARSHSGLGSRSGTDSSAID